MRKHTSTLAGKCTVSTTVHTVVPATEVAR